MRFAHQKGVNMSRLLIALVIAGAVFCSQIPCSFGAPSDDALLSSLGIDYQTMTVVDQDTARSFGMNVDTGDQVAVTGFRDQKIVIKVNRTGQEVEIPIAGLQ